MPSLRIYFSIFTLVLLAACSEPPRELTYAERIEQESRIKADQAQREIDKTRADCTSNVPSLLDQHKASMVAKRYAEAAELVRKCADALNDSQLTAAMKVAEIAGHKAVLADPKSSLQTKLTTLQMMSAAYPEDAKGYDGTMAALAKQLDQATTADTKSADAKVRSWERNRGVRIGMTAEAVWRSSWGKPQYVNTTTTAYGSREQWVYGGGNYLYFEDGRLVAIQN